MTQLQWKEPFSETEVKKTPTEAERLTYKPFELALLRSKLSTDLSTTEKELYL